MAIKQGNSGDDTLFGENGDDTLIGLGGNDSLFGYDGNDSLLGGDGDDWLEGGAGDDTLDGGAAVWADTVNYYSAVSAVDVSLASGSASGGAGSDTLLNIENVLGTQFSDQLTGDAKSNYLAGGDGDDTLTGLAGNDTPSGLAGDDILIGGAGIDSLIGGDGDDSYGVDVAGDVIVELADGGTDQVDVAFKAAGTYVLAANVENATIIGATPGGNVTGNAAGNVILANDLSALLSGLAGDDTLAGGLGADTLDGCLGGDRLTGGNDVCVVDSLADTVLEAVDAGADRELTALASLTLADNVEHLIYTGSAAFAGAGNELANSLVGGAGNDTLSGLAGDDTLIGGAGIDSLIGGGGDDEYWIDVGSDVVNESAVGSAGVDLVKIGFTSAGSYTLSAGVENALVTSAGSSIAVAVTGNALANTLSGHAGANLLAGLDGSDTLISAGGNDTLDGGSGTDTAILDGVLNDYAIARPTSAETTFTNIVGATVVSLRGIENVIFSGDATPSPVALSSLIARIGSVDNDVLTGTGGDDTMAGGLGDDGLFGGGGNDDLQGGNGRDTLTGGGGNDLLDGGIGNDSYRFAIGDGDDIIDQNDAVAASIDIVEVDPLVGDLSSGETTLARGWHSYDDLVITVNSGSSGAEGVDHIVVKDFISNDLINAGTIDQIRFSGSSLSQTQILSELLKGTAGDDWLRGYANSNDSISGNSGNDSIGGAAGNDSLVGGLGSDFLYGDAGNDSLDGGSGSDELFGGDGNDSLCGGAGNDVLAGGAGSDTYVFGVGFGQDRVADSGAASDFDTLRFTAGTRSADVTVARSGDSLEVSLVGGDQLLIDDYFNASGLGLLEQFSFADGSTWSATAIRAKVLVPTDGNDQLTGYLGSESLKGMGGDDTIDGGAGNDTLAGGDGMDWLTGGSGADRFVFDTALNGATNVDTIADFVSGTDRIGLSASVFTGLGAVGAVVGLSEQLLYDSATGALSYDHDGVGGDAALSFATLGSMIHPVSLGMDFMIVA